MTVEVKAPNNQQSGVHFCEKCGSRMKYRKRVLRNGNETKVITILQCTLCNFYEIVK